MTQRKFTYLLVFLLSFFFEKNIFAQTVNLGPDVAVCAASTVIGTPPEPGITYEWSKPDGTLSGYIVIDGSSATVNQTGTYILTATNPSTGDTASDEIFVVIDTPPTVTLPSGQVLCTNGTPYTISPSGSFGASPSFAWYKNGVLIPGETSPTLTVSNAVGNQGTYMVVVTKIEPPACTGSASIFIDIVPPPIDVLSPDTLICALQGTVRTYPFLAGHSYLWETSTETDGGILSAPNLDTIRVNKSGKYYLRLTSPSGCVRYDSIKVKLAKPTATNLGGPYLQCTKDGKVTLRAKHPDNANKVTYKWYKNGDLIAGANADSLQVFHPNQTHVYNAVMTDTTGGYSLCTTSSTFAEVRFVTPPSATITGHNPATGTCQLRDTLLLQVTNVTNYFTQWSGPGILGFANDSLQVFVDKTGKYSVKLIDSLTNCDTTLFIDVTFHKNPVVNLGEDKVFCRAQGVYVLRSKHASHETGATYTWYKNGAVIAGANADSLRVFETGTFDYSVKVVQPTGCEKSDTVRITFNPEPAIFIRGHDPKVGTCSRTATLRVDGQVSGMNTEWFYGDFGNSIAVNKLEITADTSGIYFVRVKNPLTNCFSEDSIRVVIHPQIFVKLPADTLLCQYGTLEMNAKDPSHDTTAVYEWKLLNLVNPSLSKILGEEPVFTATFGDNLSFEKRFYSVTVTDTRTGCSASDTIIVQFERQPETDAGFDQTVCYGDFVTLNGFASKTTSYLWYYISAAGDTVVLSNEKTFNFLPEESLNVFLRTDGAGACEYALDNVLITVNKPQKVKINVDNSSTFCIGDPIVLEAIVEGEQDGLQYIWNTGEITKAITVFPEDTTTYRVRVIDSKGCTSGDSVILFIQTPFEFADTLLACEGETRKIGFKSDNPIARYLWSTGDTTPFITIDSTAIYTLKLITGECVFEQSTFAWFKSNPRIFMRTDTVMCFEDETRDYTLKRRYIFPVLNNPDRTAKYFFIWNDEDGNVLSRKDTLWTEKPGTYRLTVTTDLGCTASDTIRIEEKCPPRIWLPEGFTPDGDGINERFTVFGAHIIKFDMQIINRWGETVYHKYADVFEDIREEEWWDGTYRDSGVKCPDGLYYWTITYYSKLRPYYPLRSKGFLILVK